jgi:glycosyltransferase involved in cell wall biosynthesis
VPKISIIVPVYNTEKYLKKCLDSLVNQSLKDIEIIIVNDGSTDNSQNIIDEYKNKYPKLIKSYIKENGGLSDARNFGYDKAKGEYIGFVDSDDYVDITMYEKLYQKAIDQQADIVECNFIWEYPNKEKVDIANNYEQTKDILTNIRVMVCNKIFKKDIIDKANIRFPLGLRYEDVLFTYMLIPHIKKIAYINEPLLHYVQRNDSISNYQTEKVRDIYIILNNVLNYYKKNNLYKKYIEELEYIYIRYILGSSFLRTIKVKNKDLRNNILDEGWSILNNQFPNWKKNKYLNNPGLKNKYYKMINYPIYKINAIIFKLLNR